MTLQQIFDWCNRKSYYSRDASEVWAAINSAAHLLYKEVVLENSGYFIVFDTTNIVWNEGQEEYPLIALNSNPAVALPVEQIVRMREQIPGEITWRVVFPAGLNDQVTVDANFGFNNDTGCDSSPHIYNGPYLKMTDAETGDQIYSVRIEPIPQETHNVELVYTADFLEIENASSQLIIDIEGHDALKCIALAELLDANDDDAAMRWFNGGGAEDQSIGAAHKRQYLKLVRNRQIQMGRVQEPYIADMD